MTIQTHRPTFHRPTHIRVPVPQSHTGVWIAFPVIGLLAMAVMDLFWVGIAIPVLALALVVAQRARPLTGVRWVRTAIDRGDFVAIAVMYLLVVALFRTAFTGFGTDRVAGLFLSFGVGLILGVAGPVWYIVWYRHESLASLGIGRQNLAPTIAFGVLLAAVQFALTLWGYHLPRPVDWVPLLVMSVVVGAFEAVFFRGFIQQRLEANLGVLPGTAAGAGLYAIYHVGYGMGMHEMVFLFGLGAIYAVAFRVTGNVLVLWPLLTPMGAFFNNLDTGDIDLPWASIAGFADVAAIMAAVLVFAYRHQRRRTAATSHG